MQFRSTLKALAMSLGRKEAGTGHRKGQGWNMAPKGKGNVRQEVLCTDHGSGQGDEEKEDH